MSYRKSIKGNGNESNEQFAHNRIYIEAGISGLVLVLFVIVLVSIAIGWMIIRQGTLFSFLIVASFLSLFVGAGIVGACFVWVRISDALRQVRVNKILSTTVIAGELVAYRNGDEWDHLSAQHEMAKIPQHTGVQVTEERADYTDSMITELYDKGLSRRAIAKALDIPYNRIQKLLEGKP